MSPPERFSNVMSVPRQIPSEYTSLTGISPNAIYGRLLVLNQFSQNVLSSWRLFSSYNYMEGMDVFYVNPLLTNTTRILISSTLVGGLMGGVLSKTANTSSHGPSVTIHRIEKE